MKFNKSVIIIIILVILAFISGILYINTKTSSKIPDDALWENYQVQEKTINGKELRLIVADTPDRWSKGLMFIRKPVSDFDGMIFIFPDYNYRTFWNLNTYENLTLYWMKDDVVTGTSQLPSIETSTEIVRVSSEQPVNIVVEVIE